LFERLMATDVKLSMLKTQYRMHPVIRQFPSDHFYDAMLEDAPSVAARAQPYHATPCFGPFVFYDVRHSVEATQGASHHNEEEAKVVLGLYRLLVQTYPDITDFATRVGIISPYKQQVQLLRTLFKEFPGVNVDTVDGYQGREREIIFFSSVRAPAKGSKANIGFLSDVRRMNVALTRPLSSLIVVGNSRALKSNEDWRAMVAHAVASNCYVRVQKKVEEFLPQITQMDEWTAHLSRSVEETNQSALKRKNAIEKKEKKDKKNKNKKIDNEKEEAAVENNDVSFVEDILVGTEENNEDNTLDNTFEVEDVNR